MTDPMAVRDVIRNSAVEDVHLKAAAAVDQGTKDELPFIRPPDTFYITFALNAEFGMQGVWWTITGIP